MILLFPLGVLIFSFVFLSYGIPYAFPFVRNGNIGTYIAGIQYGVFKIHTRSTVNYWFKEFTK